MSLLKLLFFKTDISGHFPIGIIISLTEKLLENKHIFLYKRAVMNVNQIVNQALYESDWVEIETCDNPSEN